MNDFEKGIKKADQLIDKAIKYRDRYGYRENLGFDQDIKLRSFLSKLNLHYQEECEVMDHFYNRAKQI
jgi:hypothetical protein